MSDDLNVKFGGDISGLEKAAQEAGKVVEGVAKKAEKSYPDTDKTKSQINAEQREKDKAERQEQKRIERLKQARIKASMPPIPDTRPFYEKYSPSDFTSMSGIGQIVGGSLGGFIGAAMSILVDAIKSVYNYVKKVADEARDLANLSRGTGIGVQQLQKLKGASIATGIPVEQLGRMQQEFNKRVGSERKQTTEFTWQLQMLGVRFKDVSNGAVQFTDVLRELQKAHKAGTDSATINNMANRLLGSSYEQLLPLINRNHDAIEDFGNMMITNTPEQIAALERLSNALDIFFKNFITSTTGMIANVIIAIENAYERLKSNPIGQALLTGMKFGTGYVGVGLHTATLIMDDVEKQKKFKEIEEGKNIKLPLQQAALGANTLQQMGGGDIFGAVAWSPQQAIAKATEDTAQSAKEIAINTRPLPQFNNSPAPQINQ